MTKAAFADLYATAPDQLCMFFGVEMGQAHAKRSAA